jgi:hypothetical protein
MSLYKIAVEFAVSPSPAIGSNFVQEFWVSAQDKQYAKYFYHKYTHENYENVNRAEEDKHRHLCENLEHSVREITEVDYVNGLPNLRRL